MKNIIEAKEALVSKPIFAVTAERFLILNEIKSKYNDLPQPKQFAKVIAELLSRVSTPVKDYDLIAGRTVDRELTDEEEICFKEFIKHPHYPSKRAILNSGHCIYSWDMLIENGISELREKVKNKLEDASGDEHIFLESMVEIYDAIIAYMLRYAKAARKVHNTELAISLEKAIYRPDDFRSALQLLWIITMINCAYISENPTLTVGRLDVILYPLYKKGINDGTLTPEFAKALITDYYCKHNLIMGRGEHQVGDESNSTTFKRILCFDAPQYLLLAGTDAKGESAVNELTQIFSECIVPEFKNPVVVVRYFKEMDKAHPQLWKTLTRKALESSSLMFYNDNNILETYERMGIPEADRRCYAHFGCNWPSLGDRSAWAWQGPRAIHYNSFINEQERIRLTKPYLRMNCEHSWPEDFMLVMRELAEHNETNIEELYSGFFARMSDFMDKKLERIAEDITVRRRRPCAVLTFGDCFYKDSLEKAQCISACAKYMFELFPFQMFGTVCDMFITVDKLVFIDKKLTLKQLLSAVDVDFEGYPDVLALCKNVNKYGSDTPHSNYHVKRIADTASSMAIEKSQAYLKSMGLFLAPCIQSDTWHLKCGEKYGATPNGRRKGAPFSQNTRPSNSACINGITAMFNSMLNITSNGILSGALNLDIQPQQFDSETGRETFAALLAAYFNQGGLHAQVSVANVQSLKSAQKDPQEHRDIRVRVTGYSGIFVDLPKRLQDDIIKRFEN